MNFIGDLGPKPDGSGKLLRNEQTVSSEQNYRTKVLGRSVKRVTEKEIAHLGLSGAGRQG